MCWRKSAFQLICLKRSGDDQVRRDWCSFLWKFNQFPTSFSKRLLISRTRSKSESSKFHLLRNHDCWNKPKKKSHWHQILKLEMSSHRFVLKKDCWNYSTGGVKNFDVSCLGNEFFQDDSVYRRLVPANSAKLNKRILWTMIASTMMVIKIGKMVMLKKIRKMWTMEWWSNCGWWQLGEGVE